MYLVFVQKKIINIYHNNNFYTYGIPVDCASFFFFFFFTTEKKILILSHLPLIYVLLEIDIKDVQLKTK